MANDTRSQVYDNVLKRLLERHGTEIIPHLLEGSKIEVLEELNVEVLIPPRRNDRVFRSLYRNESHIAHFEIEISGKSKMDVRLLIYHGLLLEKYNLPIISVIIYPFKTTMVTSPLYERSGDAEILTFHFHTVPLWKLDARKYMEERDVCMYALLPAMSGATLEMHFQAIEQMVECYRDDENELRDQLMCFGVMLRRAEMLPQADLEEVLNRMYYYDPLIEEDKYLMAIVDRKAEKKAEERVEEVKKEANAKVAEAKAEARTKAEIVLQRIIQSRFPELANTILPEVTLPDNQDALDLLLVLIGSASDEEEARKVLRAFVNNKSSEGRE